MNLRVRLSLVFALTLGVWWLASPTPSHASRFNCEAISDTDGGHQLVYQHLTTEYSTPPASFYYCHHDKYPRWIARWDPFETFPYQDEIWRRFATARCMDQNGEFNCRVTEHVVAGDSHVVIDLPSCDIDLKTLTELHASVSFALPGHEIKEVKFTVVEDGGAWSPSEYGYSVRLRAPPDFSGGSIRRVLKLCNQEQCEWQIGHGGDSWFGGSSQLDQLRREQGDPLIEAIEP